MCFQPMLFSLFMHSAYDDPKGEGGGGGGGHDFIAVVFERGYGKFTQTVEQGIRARARGVGIEKVSAKNVYFT